MKRPLLIFLAATALMGLVFAFTPINTQNKMNFFKKGNPYTNLWAKVDSLQQQGLPKSALEVVDVIYEKAKAEKNDAQLVKAIVHQMKFVSQIEEEPVVLKVERLEAEIAKATFPAKNMLLSLQAQIYWQYYEQNSWQFQDRTETVDFVNNDIRTWTLSALAKKVIELHLAALEGKTELQKTPIEAMRDVITGDSTTRPLRATMYDFLAHRALDFFRNDALFLGEPVYKFYLAGPGYFAQSSDFAKLEVETRDSMSLRFYAIGIMRDLVAFHLHDSDPSALIDAELIRLGFVRANSTHENKDELYLKALEKLEQNHIRYSASTQVSYYMASFHNEKGSGYVANDPGKEDLRLEKKIAIDICDAAIQRFQKESMGKHNCKSLKMEILSKTMGFTNEEITPAAVPFRLKVDYKNVDSLYLRAVKLEDKDRKKMHEGSTEDWIKALRSRSPVKSWVQTLTKEEDFQSHAAEIAAPALDYGWYVILAGTSKNLSYSKEAVAYSYIWVSDLSYLVRNNPQKGQELFVIQRNTGAPLAGVEVVAWRETYDYTSREYVSRKVMALTTDEDGYALLPVPDQGELSEGIYFVLKNNNDHLDTRTSFYRYPRPELHEESITTTHYFTDRSIYRPGQTVYFKGIMVKSTGEKREIVANYPTTVRLLDVNYQEVAKLDVTTNEFGSFHGSFTAPMGVLTGEMRLQDDHGSAYFSVEEYKRPKFEVKFNPVEGSFKLGSTVKVTGNAKAYAGSNIDGAAVKYRVVRQARFPWCWWFRGYYPTAPAMEITSGVSTTDDAGLFEISFEAVPDPGIAEKMLPEFGYTVYADITDVTGETRSATTSVSVGFVALSMSVNVPEAAQLSEFKEIRLSSRNLNGQFEPAKGHISIHRLKKPERIFRSRLWERSDRFLISKENYLRDFPEDIYDNEDDPATWAREAEALSADFDTEKADSLLLKGVKQWPEGQYVFELTTADRFGKEVKIVKYFTLYDLAEKASHLPVPAWFTGIKLSCEPGEKASFAFATGHKEFHLLYEREFKGEITHREWITLSNEKRLFEIVVEEQHRGNFGFSLTGIHSGRLYNYQNQVYVPWSNKDLKMEWATFRNKLQPGAKEEWRLTIKGPKGDAELAEMAAAMYDASLDAFRDHGWYMNLWPSRYTYLNWESSGQFSTASANLYHDDWNSYLSTRSNSYEYFNWFGYSFWSYRYYSRNRTGAYYSDDDFGGAEEMDMSAVEISDGAPAPAPEMMNDESKEAQKSVAMNGNAAKNGEKDIEAGNVTLLDPNGENQKGGKEAPDMSDVKVRTNLNETAFFFPQLLTDEKGNVVLSFTMPEALTRWRFLGFAHTKDLKTGFLGGETVTQKELMVMPNPPRFFREGDRISFTAKVSNLADKDLEGTAVLQLFDALNMQPIDAQMGNTAASKSFTVKKGLSEGFSWDLTIPEGIQAVTYRVIAKAGDFSDGEESSLPVLTNRMLVTESMPLPVRPKQTRKFVFDKLVNNQSTTLKHHKLTLEFTANPAWYAVQALPYLMEYPYECAEQVFSRFYANSLASHIANSHPRIKQVFESWKTTDKEALLSNLEKNQELKYLLLEETPWVLQSQDESERKKRVGLLFDLNKMSNELNTALKKLQKSQVSNGGWPWFPGMPESRYITQHIVTGMGHLDHLGVRNIREDAETWQMVSNAVRYLDDRINDDYQWLVNHDADLSKNHLGGDHIQYLYARSYFSDIEIDDRNQKAFEYYRGQAITYWLENSKYMQGMIALALHRFAKTADPDNKTTDPKTRDASFPGLGSMTPGLDAKGIPAAIIKSLKEKSLTHDELGMYWADNSGGYYWYQAPIETQALMIEAFDEVANDKASVEEMKIWLLKQKQTQDWKTTKATVEACYALLLRGTELLSESTLPVIRVGGKIIDPLAMENMKVEAGTGYFKTAWSGSEVSSAMGRVEVENLNQVVAWGAMYWQYFEQLDKITPHETPLKLKKLVFLEENSDRGPVIRPVEEGTVLKPGDKLKIRIELRVDRDMEYLHMKDMRASGFEPIDVMSQYKYQDGLGYYESTRDAATNFFIGWLPKGTYVFEYPLVVQHRGNFSNGITTIQCMYAPEFTSHSEGIRVKVK